MFTMILFGIVIPVIIVIAIFACGIYFLAMLIYYTVKDKIDEKKENNKKKEFYTERKNGTNYLVINH